MEQELKKLNLLRNRIMFMRDSKEKALLIKDYNNIVAFLYNAGYIQNIDEYAFESDDESIYEKLYERNVMKMVKELTSCPKELISIFQSIINYYHKYSFTVKLNYSKIKVNPSKMQGALSSFFWNIDDDSLALFQKMTRERRFIQNDLCQSEGIAINTMNTDFAYAVVNNSNDDLEYYLSIPHEMGHVYAMYLQRMNPNFINVEITSEVVSLLFEKLFLYFLEINDFLYYENLKSQVLHHSYMLNHLSVSKIIMNLYQQKLIRGYDKDLLTIFPKVNEEEILRVVSEDCGIQYKTLSRFDYSIVTYPIGEIISNYFFFEIIDDHDKGMLDLRKFIVSCQRMTMEELIKNYMTDLSPSFTYIDLFMKKYKSKKKIIVN